MASVITAGAFFRLVYYPALAYNNRMNGDLILDVTVKTKKNKFTSKISFSKDFDFTGHSIHQVLFPYLNAPIVGDAENPCAELVSGIHGATALTTANATGIQWWTPDCPAMYRLTTELVSPEEEVIYQREDIIAFRDIQFDGKKLLLNGILLSQKIKDSIQLITLPLDKDHVKQSDQNGSLIVIKLAGNEDEKSLLTALDGLRNSPSLIGWYISQKSSYKPLCAILSAMDDTRPVIKEFFS